MMIVLHGAVRVDLKDPEKSHVRNCESYMKDPEKSRTDSAARSRKSYNIGIESKS